MPTAVDALWELTRGRPEVDAGDLARAIALAAREGGLDSRSRRLIHDAADALERRWGVERLGDVFRSLGAAEAVAAERAIPAPGKGFDSLEERLVNATDPATILAFFRELGSQLPNPATLRVGGSTSLILQAGLRRSTEDIDAVDELPEPIRVDHALLNSLRLRYGLRLTHFQSHYLPDGWDSRLRDRGTFGLLHVLLVDPLDVLGSKLVSGRDRDLDDLRILAPKFGRESLRDHLLGPCARLVADPIRRANAERNWYVVFGEPLPAV
ncbi:MAG TPA: DUF6036 family nucleotidyltransferase [Isosphaeraceae bacterium]|jgi:hypothetical protein|nr:DUF6036 family nucleotidyltransferase [Isosphaeraceae bacterium]